MRRDLVEIQGGDRAGNSSLESDVAARPLRCLVCGEPGEHFALSGCFAAFRERVHVERIARALAERDEARVYMAGRVFVEWASDVFH